MRDAANLNKDGSIVRELNFQATKPFIKQNYSMSLLLLSSC